MDVSSAATILGGLGLFLLGIHHLTEGLKDLAGDSLRRALQRLISGRLNAISSGVVFTALVQSSTAAILAVIGFVSTGLLTFSQAVGVIMGATLGTTSTPWLVAIFGFRLRIADAALPILGIGAPAVADRERQGAVVRRGPCGLRIAVHRDRIHAWPRAPSAAPRASAARM
jgi:phosphate:Na+ symporter